MSLLKYILPCLLIASTASAGLYGFSEANPYSREEKILNINVPPKFIVNYRQEMRDNINSLAEYAKEKNKDFIIIVHEGQDLLKKSLWEYHLDGYNDARRKGLDANDPAFLINLKQSVPELEPEVGSHSSNYAQNIDGLALNGIFCGKSLPETALKTISVSYCPSGNAYNAAIAKSIDKGVLLYGFINPDTAFKKIEKWPIIDENAKTISTLNDAQNINLLIDDSAYNTKADMLDAIAKSNFDVVVINPLFHSKEAFSKDEISSIKYKKNGPKRLIIALQNISEIKDTDPYWKKGWTLGNPSFLVRPSFVDKNGVIARYWDYEWKKLMSKYFKAIVATEYDGAFLTGLENHSYFEKQTPLE